MLLVSGCVTPLPRLQVIDTPEWRQRQIHLSELQQWQLHGRAVLQMNGKGTNLSLHWQHQPSRQQLDLSGPLGRGHIQVSQDKNGAVLTNSKRQRYAADNIQRLIYDTSGWLLPVDHMVYWVRGIPDPGQPNRAVLDDRGRLKHLQQSGWHIEYTKYMQAGNRQLPGRITLSRPAGKDNGNMPAVKMRLAVSRWVLDNSAATTHH